jgi:ubiquitin carboxyl-terminal hydrolase L3
MTTAYYKHFIPLEFNPELFTQLMHQLGGGPSLTFEDVFSLDSPDLLAFIERPVHALVLTFPTTRLYEEYKRTEEDKLKVVSTDKISPNIL